MSRPTVEKIQPRGAEGERYVFTFESVAIDIDTSIEGGYVDVLLRALSGPKSERFDGVGGVFLTTVRRLIAARDAHALFDDAERRDP